MSKNINAKDILSLLKSKHFEDIFIPECKDGPTWDGHQRLDAWVMKPSWAHPLTIGYEIKISRSDFINDNKWRGYLQHCNEFYFVTPWKLVNEDEIPDGIGVLYVTQTGNRLICKKKAKYREVEISESFYRYILMCRCEVVEYSKFAFRSDIPIKEKAENFYRDKEYKHTLGSWISKNLKKIIDEKIDKIEDENKKLKEENKKLLDIKDILKELGIKSNLDIRYLSSFGIKNKIECLKNIIPENFDTRIQRLHDELGRMQEEIKKLKEQGLV